MRRCAAAPRAAARPRRRRAEARGDARRGRDQEPEGRVHGRDARRVQPQEGRPGGQAGHDGRRRRSAPERPRREPERRGRHLEPSGDSRPVRRPPPHPGGRHGPHARLPQPHELAALVRGPDPHRERDRLLRDHSGQRRRGQHRGLDPGQVRAAQVRDPRQAVPRQRVPRLVLPQQRQCPRLQPRGDGGGGVGEPHVPAVRLAVGELQGRGGLQARRARHRGRRPHPGQRGRLLGLSRHRPAVARAGAADAGTPPPAGGRASRRSASRGSPTSAWT